MRCLIVLALLLAGCGTRTALDLGGESSSLRDAGRRDAGRRDAGRDRPDAGRRDAGFDAGRDAGPPRDTCQSDRECMDEVCRGSADDAPRDLAPIGLFCGDPESDPAGAPGSPCRERTTCDRHLCTVSGTCVMPCRTDAECVDGEICRETWVQTSASTMQSLRACTARLALPPSVRVTGPEPGPILDAVAVGDTVPNPRPNGLIIWVGPPDSEPLIESIATRGADADLVFDVFSPRSPGDPAPAWGIGPATVRDLVTLLIPNGPNTPRSRDGYDVFLSSTLAGPSERITLRRRDPGTLIDIDAYLVGGGGWRSPGGEVPPPLERGLDDVRRMIGGLGLSIGDVRMHEVVGGLRRRFEVLEGEGGLLGAPPDLAPLYRLSAGATRPSVSVFFVRMIDGAVGIASGIPGPHGMPGTGASGVAIAVDLIPDEVLGKVLVHEIGHFMGLFHTSEADGTITEPLPDTGECGPDRDTDRDGFVVPEECVGAGGDNVMFWTGLGEEISPQQGEMMGRAYFVRQR